MSAISVPFKFNEFGQVEVSTSEGKFWKDQILLTLMTRFGERVLRPNFGSSVGDSVFEPSDLAADTAANSIKISFNTWLPKLRLIEVTPEFNENSGFLEVTLVYVLPSGESDTITLNTAIFNRTGDILQEIPSGQ